MIDTYRNAVRELAYISNENWFGESDFDFLLLLEHESYRNFVFAMTRLVTIMRVSQRTWIR